MARNTLLEINGENFLINGERTFNCRSYEGHLVEGLLPNSRMIQGVFDDLNPETRGRWDYPDGPWDPDRNTDAFLAAMPVWKAHGLLAFTIGLQGGSPYGYSSNQPWENTAFTPKGDLRPEYLGRLGKILSEADRLGMIPILSLFYFGQVDRFEDETAVPRAVDSITDWLLEENYLHLLIEIANETDNGKYQNFPIFRGDRVPELIQRVRERSRGKVDGPADRLLVGTSFNGGSIPTDEVISTSDVVLMHGNGVKSPDRIREMVREVRDNPVYRGQPIVFNEDDHFDFDQPDNHFLAALSEHASWGYFDYRMKGETAFEEGYQSMPCDWGISSERKRGFFDLVAEITGSSV